MNSSLNTFAISGDTAHLISIGVVAALMIAGIFCLILLLTARDDIKEARKKQSANALVFHPEDFLRSGVRFSSCGAGVWIIFNETRNWFYPVSSEGDAPSFIASCFSGTGHGGIYMHYHKGDSFVVKFLPLSGSSYHSIAEMMHGIQLSYSTFATEYALPRK